MRRGSEQLTIRWRERQLSRRKDRKMLSSEADECKLEHFTRYSTEGLRRAQGTGHQNVLSGPCTPAAAQPSRIHGNFNPFPTPGILFAHYVGRPYSVRPSGAPRGSHGPDQWLPGTAGA